MRPIMRRDNKRTRVFDITLFVRDVDENYGMRYFQ